MIDDVSDIIRRVGTVEVLNRWRRLADGDIEEKSPGDLVTIADRECELALIPELQAIRDVPVIGEESVASDSRLRDILESLEAAWIVDPVDGTANFAAGKEDFAVMVALTSGTSTIASWIWHPPTGRMVVAERGAGAWRDGERLAAEAPSGALAAVIKRKYVPAEVRPALDTIADDLGAGVDKRCAGIEYTDLAEGRTHAYFFWRTHPWDHAPGTLIAEEAGLRVGRLDGSAYDPRDRQRGLLTATPDSWDSLAERLDQALAPIRSIEPS
ncbi:MAG: inositol monophosphatase [Actinomycetota bacterium]